MNSSLDTSLTRSLATESLSELLGNVSETALDSVIESGALRDIPIIGLITGTLKTARDIKSVIFLRKVTIFLKNLAHITDKERRLFVDKFDSDEKQHEFGQSILMILDHVEDLTKPKLIARIVSAHIQNNIDFPKTMRICAIISRCYTEDLNLLHHFNEGMQGEFTPIAESLLSVGLLSNAGIDGGNIDGDSGGVHYVINEYGRLLVKYGL